MRRCARQETRGSEEARNAAIAFFCAFVASGALLFGTWYTWTTELKAAVVAKLPELRVAIVDELHVAKIGRPQRCDEAWHTQSHRFPGSWVESEAHAQQSQLLYARSEVPAAGSQEFPVRARLWAGQACFAETAGYSFAYHGVALPRRVAAQQFVSPCLGAGSGGNASFDAERFLLAVANKTIVFGGDSVMGLVFSALLCNLGTQRLIAGRIPWTTWTEGCPGRVKPVPGTAEHCLFANQNFCVTFKHSVRVCFFGPGVFHKGVEQSVTADMLVLNYGIHVPTQNAYKVWLQSLPTRLRKLRSAGVRVIWMETIPTFFGGQNASGMYGGSKKSACRSEPLSPADVEQQNWRNRIANPLMLELGVEVLELFHMFAARPDGSMGAVTGNGDCLHMGFGGPLEVMPVILQALIERRNNSTRQN